MARKTGKKKTAHRSPSADASAQRRAPSARLGGEGGSGRREPSRNPSRALNGTAATVSEVHCTLAPLDGPAMLLPTNVVAEVVEYSTPEPVHDTPNWFLGQVEWEGRQIPVFSFSALVSGEEPAEAGPKARIVILKSLADAARVPYLGIVTRDLPRLLHVQPGQLVHTGDERKSMGVFCQVTVQDEPAIIPDLDRLTHLVTHAAYGALPITQVEGQQLP